MSRLVIRDGRIQAANLGDYKLPTIADVPPLEIVHLSDEHGAGPYGSRSAGELVNPGVPDFRIFILTLPFNEAGEPGTRLLI